MGKSKRKFAGFMLAGALCLTSIPAGVGVSAASIDLGSLISGGITTATGTSVSYKTVSVTEMPSTVKNMVSRQIASSFTKTYQDGDDLYLIAYYGQMNTGGYSVSVSSLYESDGIIYFNTKLNGPKPGTMVTCALTYPYIVVKIQATDKPVVFNVPDRNVEEIM